MRKRNWSEAGVAASFDSDYGKYFVVLDGVGDRLPVLVSPGDCELTEGEAE